MQTLQRKVEGLLDIRNKELPEFEARVLYAQHRMTRANRYLVRQKMKKINLVKSIACWKALVEHMKEGKREKNKVKRCLVVLRKYVTHHFMRKWKVNHSVEVQIKDKNKIEGAYLLLRRYKNRLKAFDEAVKVIHENMADKKDFAELKKSIQPGRNVAVMEDMKLLFDSTVKQFDKRLIAEKNQLAATYDRIIQKQKNMVLAFEMKYSNMIKSRIDRVEAFTNDLAMEQARLTACAGMH